MCLASQTGFVAAAAALEHANGDTKPAAAAAKQKSSAEDTKRLASDKRSLLSALVDELGTDYTADLWGRRTNAGLTPLQCLCSSGAVSIPTLRLATELSGGAAAWEVRVQPSLGYTLSYGEEDLGGMTAFHMLCGNPACSATILKEVDELVSADTDKSRLLWLCRAGNGQYPMHRLCENRNVSTRLLLTAAELCAPASVAASSSKVSFADNWLGDAFGTSIVSYKTLPDDLSAEFESDTHNVWLAVDNQFRTPMHALCLSGHPNVLRDQAEVVRVACTLAPPGSLLTSTTAVIEGLGLASDYDDVTCDSPLFCMAQSNRSGFQAVVSAPWLMEKSFWMDPAVVAQTTGNPNPKGGGTSGSSDPNSGLAAGYDPPWAGPPPGALRPLPCCARKGSGDDDAEGGGGDGDGEAGAFRPFDDPLWIATKLEDMQSVDLLLDGVLQHQLLCYLTNVYEDLKELLDANLMNRACRLLQGGLQVVSVDMTRSKEIHVNTLEAGFDCGEHTCEAPVSHCDWVEMGRGDLAENWQRVMREGDVVAGVGRKVRMTDYPAKVGRIKALEVESAEHPAPFRARVEWDSDGATDGAIGQRCMLHVRNVGQDGWDGTEEGRGTYESAEALSKIFSRFGDVVSTEVRHRISLGTGGDGLDENTSWALVTMATKAACDRAMQAGEHGGVNAGMSLLKISRFDKGQAFKSKGHMSQIRRQSLAAIDKHSVKMRRSRSSLSTDAGSGNFVSIEDISIECVNPTWLKLEQRGRNGSSTHSGDTAKESDPVVMTLAKAAYCAVADEEQCCGLLSLLLRYDSFWEDREIPEVVSALIAWKWEAFGRELFIKKLIQHFSMVMAWQQLATLHTVVESGQEYPLNGHFGDVPTPWRLMALAVCLWTGTLLPSRRLSLMIAPCLARMYVSINFNLHRSDWKGTLTSVKKALFDGLLWTIVSMPFLAFAIWCLTAKGTGLTFANVSMVILITSIGKIVVSEIYQFQVRPPSPRPIKGAPSTSTGRPSEL
eukprot:COSAG05_NODE_386_length_10463_cov_4.066673_5_plen_1003_part_00